MFKKTTSFVDSLPTSMDVSRPVWRGSQCTALRGGLDWSTGLSTEILELQTKPKIVQ